MSDAPKRSVKRVRTHWSDVVLVCRKCSRKLDGGFGPGERHSFRRALKRSLKDRSDSLAAGEAERSIGIIEVDCRDLCPKGAVVAMQAGRPEAWLVIPRGTPIEDAMARLGLGPGSKASAETVAPVPASG